MLAELSLCIKLLVLWFACESLRQPVVNVCLPLFFFLVEVCLCANLQQIKFAHLSWPTAQVRV